MRHKPDLVDLRFDLYGSRPRHITTGDDRALWVTCATDAEVVGLFSDGTIERFPVDGMPDQIVRGTTTIWFTVPLNDAIGFLDHDGKIVTHQLADGSNPQGLVTLDDVAWVTLAGTGELASVTSEGVITVVKPIIMGDEDVDPSTTNPRFASVDERRSIWFTRSGSGDVIRLDPDGTTESWTFPDLATPSGISVDRDAVWITDSDGGGIWRIGQIEKLLERVEPWPKGVSTNIAADRNGGCWFTEETEDLVAHIGVDAKLTEWDLSDYGERPRGIVVDEDGVAWVALRTGGIIGVTTPKSDSTADEPDYTVI
jgi:streptogramin lyase